MILLKDILLEGEKRNILIDGNSFVDTSAPTSVPGAREIPCGGKAIVPAFYNTHTHAAMMPMRGGGDDLPLDRWLQDYIWPYEAGMTSEDIRKGDVLALQEMKSSGTVFFNDMYFDIEETISEVCKAGTRACIGITIMENHSKVELDGKLDFLNHWQDPSGGRISIAIAPHAIYTVGTERLKMAAALARDNGLKIHIHLSETLKEVEDCLKEHGMTPVNYLDSIGFLGPDVVAAHCVHVNEQEWDLLAERGVSVSHCPCSNMKLGSGRFPYELAIKSGVRITLGTDSASSNNNLDMREEMKFAALLAKVNGDPQLLPARQVLSWATENGAAAFGIKSGRIEAGYLADAVLLDLDNVRLQPANDIISSWVYAADSGCITDVMCDGKFV